MQAWIAGVAAAFAGIVLGFWLKAISAKAEKEALERRVRELTGELASARGEVSELQAGLAARAGFASLSEERLKTIARLEEEQKQLRAEIEARTRTERDQAARISHLETQIAQEEKNLAEKLALLETAKDALANQFKALAAGILEEKTRSFSAGSQKELGTLLGPLKTQIDEFRKKVEEAQTDSKTGVTRLETLIGALGGLNQQLSEEARNLTTALRGSAKAQGDWGEMIARNLLEKAGLREGEQFREQESFEASTEADERRKRARPDLIVNLPGGRHLVIDSKVSLNAYTDSVNANSDEERKAAVKRHLASVRAHVDELAARSYHKLSALDTPDFTVMFIPIEPAFLAALHEDESLWRYAYEKEVLLVGPTTLLFVIRIVDNLWQQEIQARGVQDVMNRGAELYEKFVGFVSDLEGVGKNLRGAEQSYSNAMKKLSEGRGNLIRQVEMLKELGVRTGKSLPSNLLDAAGLERTQWRLGAEGGKDGEPAP
ncbi:MAG: DNA recombination protein RmuC [Terracidiphilus sp.]